MLQLDNIAYNLIGFVLTWVCLLTGLWISILIYSLATCRYKKIKLYSISKGYGLRTACLIDTNLVHYYVEPNHILGSKDLIEKIHGLTIGSDYIVKIYSFDTNWTKVKLIDFKPC
jgi:hypothetical protein